MKTSAHPVQTIFAAGVGTSAFAGFLILNLAAAEIVGLPIAIAAGIVSGTLNSIFHSLPIQRADMPKSIKEGLLLTFALLISILGTGYVYASSEASVKKVISDNPAYTMPIALSYQASFALPIAFLLNGILQQLLGWKRPPTAANKINADEAGALLLTSGEEGIDTTSINESTALFSKPRESTKIKCGKMTLKALSYVIGSSLLISFASAAYELFKPKDAAPLSTVSQFYQPIYGTNFYLTLSMHFPILLLAAWGTEDGMYAGYHSAADLIKKPSAGKGTSAVLTVAILAFTSIATYLISSFGDVSLGLTIAAMIAAIMSNYASATITADASTKLFADHPRAAARRFTDEEPVTTFYKKPVAILPLTTITATPGG